MLPHHRPTSSEELKSDIRSRRRPPVLPRNRLLAARGWNLPVPEILVLLVWIVTDTLYLSGAISLIIGIPLLFVPLRVFWFDIAYIVTGLIIFQYMMTFIDGSYILLGLIPIAAIGMVISGTSYLVRRALAYLFARRRVQE